MTGLFHTILWLVYNSFSEVNKKNTINSIFLLLLFIYHRPYIILQLYYEMEYFTTVGSHIKCDDAVYTASFTSLLMTVYFSLIKGGI